MNLDGLRAFRDDWRPYWFSYLVGVTIMLGFSQGWQCPFFGYATTLPAGNGGLIQATYYPVYLCGIVMGVLAWRRLVSTSWRTILLICLVGMCLVSAAWSIDPSTTIRRFVALLMTTTCAYTLASRFTWKRLTEIIASAFVVLTIASYFMAIVFPEKGRMVDLFPGAWRGVWAEKNSLGDCMGLGFMSAVAAALHNPTRRFLWGAAAMAMLGLVLMSTSKTALVTIFIGLAALTAIWVAQRGPILGILVSWTAISGILGLVALAMIAPQLLFAVLGKDATFTGRTFIWDGIMRQIHTRPNTGFGYGVVWTTEGPWTPLAKIIDIAGFRPYHAHSCWLEVWLGLGIGGLVLWSILFAETWLKGFYRVYKGDGGYFALPFLAMFSLGSFTESFVLMWNDLRWCLAVLVIVKLSLKGDANSVWIPAWARPAKKAQGRVQPAPVRRPAPRPVPDWARHDL